MRKIASDDTEVGLHAEKIHAAAHSLTGSLQAVKPLIQVRWLIVTFATPGDGDPAGEFAGPLAQLFDSIILTFRWITDQAAG
jgi:hypothetical protein